MKKEGINKGRVFYKCPKKMEQQCRFSKWTNIFRNEDGSRITKNQFQSSGRLETFTTSEQG